MIGGSGMYKRMRNIQVLHVLTIFACISMTLLILGVYTTCFASSEAITDEDSGIEMGAKMTEETNGEKLYRKVFSEYVVKTLNLDRYDQELLESSERFIPKEDQEKSDAQKADLCGLSYIYIRNGFHFDRLSPDNKNLLEEEAENIREDSKIPQDVIDLVKASWPNIVSYQEIKNEDDRKILTFYDESMSPEFVTVDTLELKIATSPEFDKNGNYVDINHEGDKTDKLKEFASNMETELQGKLGIVPIRVFLDL